MPCSGPGGGAAGLVAAVTAANASGGGGINLASGCTYGLSAAGMSRAQIESPQSWGDAPEIFVHSFNHTVHVVNFFTILSVLFSVVRGPRREIRQR